MDLAGWKLSANTVSICDLGGNVWEWCEDQFNANQSPRVLRGGAWSTDGDCLSSSYRRSYPPGSRYDYLGFRCVLMVNTPAPPASSSAAAETRDGEERDFPIAPGMKMRFCWVPAGGFRMGSPESETNRSANEGPVRDVRISRGFWLAKNECTQGEWESVMGSNPSKFKGNQNLPLEQVRWLDICGDERRTGGFLGKVNQQAPAGWRYDLPTEAQWEYACRGGPHSRTSSFAWGEQLNGDKANCDGTYPYGMVVKGPNLGKTVEVGSYKAKAPHPLGLCDMHGNVWEWCRDRFQHSYSGLDALDPEGAATGEHRVCRGGSWSGQAVHCRTAYRVGNEPGALSFNLGFRLAMVPSG